MQTQIQFLELIEQIEALKHKRKEWLLKTGFYQDKPDYVECLLKITYDLTDKDFEYFVAYMLKNEWYTSINVQWGYDDGGSDIVAMKNWQEYLIQCKQWASPYITMKRAWEFYGTIYPLKKKHPKATIAYVTTSYMNEEVLDFFHDHYINGTISNGKLLDSCKELGLFTENGWKKMIQYIKQQRILKLRNELQKSIPIESELKKLQNQRIFELRNHLKPSMQNKYINLAKVDFSWSFFQYWDLV